MQVADLMQRNVRTVQASQPIAEVFGLLAESHISGLPVVDSHGELVGVITATDLLEELAECEDSKARDTLLDATRVEEVMTPKPETIAPDASIRDAAQRMMYLEIHRLLVTEGPHLVGVISTTDLLRALVTAAR